MIEGWGARHELGRPDQYLILFIKRYRTRHHYQGICPGVNRPLFIKLNGLTMPFSSEFVQSQPGYAMLSTITLGGIDSDGRDAVNELSYFSRGRSRCWAAFGG